MAKPKHSNSDWGVALFVICVAAFIFTTFSGGGGDNKPKTKPIKQRAAQEIAVGKVAVYDGDTLKWTAKRPLRLLQINAPERAKGCMGQEATVRLAELIGVDGNVRVVYDKKLNPDRFDRVLAYVEKDGKDVGEQLLREGYARTYFINGEQGDRAKAYIRAQSEAQKAKLGIWAACPSAK